MEARLPDKLTTCPHVSTPMGPAATQQCAALGLFRAGVMFAAARPVAPAHVHRHQQKGTASAAAGHTSPIRSVPATAQQQVQHKYDILTHRIVHACLWSTVEQHGTATTVPVRMPSPGHSTCVLLVCTVCHLLPATQQHPLTRHCSKATGTTCAQTSRQAPARLTSLPGEPVRRNHSRALPARCILASPAHSPAAPPPQQQRMPRGPLGLHHAHHSCACGCCTSTYTT
jgi:hypothetical protein